MMLTEGVHCMLCGWFTRNCSIHTEDMMLHTMLATSDLFQGISVLPYEEI